MSIITEPKPVCSCSASVSYKHIMQWSTASKTVLCPAALLQSVSPVAQSRPTLCDPMDCSMPGLPVHHQLPELAETHVHRVSDAIQPSHPLSSPSPPSPNPSQHQGLFQWVSSSHEVAKVLEFQLQHQCFQGGDRGMEFSRKRKGQTSFPLHSLVLVT